MMDEHFFIYNGLLVQKNTAIAGSGHPGLLYGDGVFETIRVHDGKIMNAHLHFSRLQQGCKVLGYDFNSDKENTITGDIQAIASAHSHERFLRVRLSIFRANNPFVKNNPSADYLIQAFSVKKPVFNDAGISAIVYPDNTKGTGILSNLKTNNYLLNILASRFAKERQNDEAIILNNQGRICETSIANIFFVEKGAVFTPSLDEGCVAGTIRRLLLQTAPKIRLAIEETTCTIDRLLNADEVFVTNAIKWVEPVSAIGDRQYKCHVARSLFDLVKDAV